MASDTQVIDLGFRPRAWQNDVFRQLKRNSVLVVHRQAGKTILAVMRLISKALLNELPDARYAYIAPELKQAKDIAWTPLKTFAANVPGVIINESETYVQFPNGARIRLYGADDPDSLRGRTFDGIVLDEVAQMKLEVWGLILRPTLSARNGWVLFIGTPDGINLFSRIYFAGTQDADWFAKLYTVHDTNVFTAAELAAMQKDMTPTEWQQEMLCDFGASSDNVLIPVAVARAATNVILREQQFNFAPRIIGVDVAWQGGDRSVIMKRQGLQSFQPIIRKGLPEKNFYGIVADAIRDFQADKTFIDITGGYGGEVLSRLLDAGFNVEGISFSEAPVNERFMNLRAEMWFKMADWVKGGGSLWKDEGIIAELSAPTYDNDNAANKLKLESKADIKDRLGLSPDIADALALTFSRPVFKASPQELQRSSQAVAEWDPYDDSRE